MNMASTNTAHKSARGGGRVDFSALLAGTALVLMGVALHGIWQGSRLESSRPIGTVKSVAPGSGWGVRLIVETETTFYPLRSLLVVEKGTPLILQVRANGDQYVCDVSQSCAKTASQNWKTNRTGGSN